MSTSAVSEGRMRARSPERQTVRRRPAMTRLILMGAKIQGRTEAD